MLSIGFDAKRLFWNFTGLGNYSRTLLRTLSAMAPDWDYHLFTPRVQQSPRLGFLQDIPRLSVHTPHGMWSALPALWRSYGIKEDIRKSGIQLYHGLSHELPAGMTGKRIRKIVTIHDLIFERYPDQYPFIDRLVYRQKFRAACQSADLVVAISEQTKQDIQDYYNIVPEKIQVVYQSCENIFRQQADAARIAAVRLKYGLPSEYLLYVGSVIERKNLLGLMRALTSLTDYPDLPVVIVGDGSAYLRKVQAYITANGLQKRIYWYKSLDFSDLPVFYQLARVFILPAFFEGFGIPIIESLNCGTPVVTSLGSCFKETAGPGALYADPASSEAIAEGIRQILSDTVLFQRLATDGKAYVRRFDQNVIGQQWIDLYTALYPYNS